MIRFFTVLLISFYSISGFSQTDTTTTFGSETIGDEYKFAVNLNSNAMGGLVNYVLIKFVKDTINHIIFLERTDFLHQICGSQTSKGNTKGINFLRRNGIEDSTIIDQLWKLRYKIYPYQGRNVEEGWATHPDKNVDYLPSDRQMQLLREFGIYKLSDYIFGDNLYNLLKSISNQEWIQKYKGK